MYWDDELVVLVHGGGTIVGLLSWPKVPGEEMDLVQIYELHNVGSCRNIFQHLCISSAQDMVG